MLFIISTIILLLAAIAIVAAALLRRPAIAAEDFHRQRAVRNVNLYRGRMQLLQQERADGMLEESDLLLLEAELGRDLVNSVGQLEAAPSVSKAARPWLFSVLMVLILPLMAVAFYQSLGSIADWKISQQIDSLTQIRDEQAFAAQTQILKQQIEQRLQQRPDNIDYRLLLARFAMSQENYADAVLHYGVLAELLPEDAMAQAYYAQALYLNNQRKINADVALYMDKTLTLDPANPTVLGMQGIDAFENGRYREAIDAWQRLLAVLPNTGERAGLIQSGINEAQSRLGESDTAPQEQSLSGIWVTVNVAEHLRDELDPNTPLFIYARAAEGPKVPLAVKRLRLADLPVRVLLDDAASMAPQFKLSAFAEVVVGARLSLSGEPIAQQGDWFAQSMAIVWRESNQQSLLIDQQVK